MARTRHTGPPVWTAPPGWPVQQPGWSPPPGWQPDPQWPAPPADWEFWQAPSAPQRETLLSTREKVGLAVGAVIAIAAVVWVVDPDTQLADVERGEGERAAWGATRDAWEASHRQAPGYVQGVAFLPLVLTFDGEVPKYSEVVDNEAGVVASYAINAPYVTTLGDAKAIVRKELDGIELGEGFRQGDRGSRCMFFFVEDEELQQALGGLPLVSIYFYEGGPEGVEYIEFSADFDSRAAFESKTC